MNEQRQHHHIRRGDIRGCAACDYREGRSIPIPPAPSDRTIYPALSEGEFNKSAWTHEGVRIVGDEDGEYFWAYGHIDPGEMTKAADDIYRTVYGVPDWEPLDPDRHVRHIHAVRVSQETDEWRIHWGAEYQEHPDRFPLTILDVDGMP